MKKGLLTVLLFLSSVFVALLIGKVTAYTLYRDKIALCRGTYTADVSITETTGTTGDPCLAVFGGPGGAACP